ncbi:MAG: DUF2147 domain-containing protein [Alphaproteobacteria bacterium]|nr:MAG: DUF2147 domain-containing protein [Alphaproteobacteria bacterium]
MTFAWLKAMAAAIIVLSAVPTHAATAAAVDPTGLWLMDNRKVAIRIDTCESGLCGRIVWLKKPFDKQGRLKRDTRNPDAAARHRPLCGIEVLRGLKPAGDGVWDGGTIYNPRDGRTYAATIRAEGHDVLKVRGYIGLPLFGKTRTLTRVQPGSDMETALSAPLGVRPAGEDGGDEGQIGRLVNVDRGLGEGHLDGPGCRTDDARQTPQRDVEG